MSDLHRDGYTLADFVIRDVARIAASLPDVGVRRGGIRNLVHANFIAELFADERLVRAVTSIVGNDAVAVKATLFDKTARANWLVQWHQDRVVAVRERREAPGFGAWSVKHGVVHAEPPAAVLEQMLAVRVHLDACGADNGPLRVIPRTHRLGKLADDAIASLVATRGVAELYVPEGGVVFMRPLLLHASSPARNVAHRRVLHIEVAPRDAIAPLEWAAAVAITPNEM
ncbi:MAG: phytanoyl-CoA dioxygenase family protein [Acidobacteria bacterium]|nr:phytanoyl-CoA dioxygenase family protein [Acidobacteriota bacterium]MBV9476879.1 phytanoyl-CoA dioxygenase family protein [Acidobacteriota bacterium]